MKKQTAVFIFILTFIVLVASLGSASARYQSAVTLDSLLDYARMLGTVTLYNPQWVYGYVEQVVTDAEGNEVNLSNFQLLNGTSTIYPNIRFQITNTGAANDKVFNNDIAAKYYVRIVPSDEQEPLHVTHKMYQYDQINQATWEIADDKLYPYDSDADLYGPFDLSNKGLEYFWFSMYIQWNCSDESVQGQEMKVQMVLKKADNSLDVLSETDLKMGSVLKEGQILINLSAYNFADYNAATGTYAPVGTPVWKIFNKGNTIDATVLNNLGIIPSGYVLEFMQAYALFENWDRYQEITIPSDTTHSQSSITVYVKPGAESGKHTVAASIVFAEDESNPSSLTIDSDNNGVFTLKLNYLNSKSGKVRNSYAIYIVNAWGTPYEIGVVNASTDVTIKYNDEYKTDDDIIFSLALNMTLLIKSWG